MHLLLLSPVWNLSKMYKFNSVVGGIYRKCLSKIYAASIYKCICLVWSVLFSLKIPEIQLIILEESLDMGNYMAGFGRFIRPDSIVTIHRLTLSQSIIVGWHRKLPSARLSTIV